MYFVYLLKSINYPEKTYIGYTKDLDIRVTEHNSGLSFHTSKYKPWEVVACIGFKQQSKALEFEQYLKSGSGNAFMLKRLL